MKLDNTNDFGFSILDEEELKGVESISVIEIELERLKTRLALLKSMILPLIENLQKEPNKNYIYWPNRKDKLMELMNKIKET